MMDQAALLRAFHTALGEQRHPAGLMDATDRFRVTRLNGERMSVQYAAVFEAHAKRVAGCGSPALCDQALQTALRSIVGQ